MNAIPLEHGLALSGVLFCLGYVFLLIGDLWVLKGLVRGKPAAAQQGASHAPRVAVAR